MISPSPSSWHIADNRWLGNFKHLNRAPLDWNTISRVLLRAGAVSGQRTDTQHDPQQHQRGGEKPAAVHQLWLFRLHGQQRWCGQPEQSEDRHHLWVMFDVLEHLEPQNSPCCLSFLYGRDIIFYGLNLQEFKTKALHFIVLYNVPPPWFSCYACVFLRCWVVLCLCLQWSSRRWTSA